MAQVERATSRAGKQYITDGVVRYTDISTRTLTAGGLNNENGLIEVLDANADLSVRLDNDGITLGTGRKIVGGDGLLTNLFYTSGGRFNGYDWLGYDLTIVSAVVTLNHTPIYWYNPDTNSEVWGYSRNIRAYKVTGNQAPLYMMAYYSSYIIETASIGKTEITGAFGTGGYTATNTNTATVQTTFSSDIASVLTTGRNGILIETANAPTNTLTFATTNTGMGQASINIIGYLK
jgi:hypothetical protein